MLGDDVAEVEDADQVGQLLDLDDTAGAIGHAVVVAADGDEAIVADAALELEHGIEAMLGQRLQLRLLGGERLGDDALGRAMDADVGDGVEPIGELSVEIVEIAEAASEEEVLADVAERPLNLALGFGPVRPAGAGLEAIVLRQRQQRAIVDDVAVIVLAGHRRLHAVVEDLDRHAAERVERLDMTAEQRLQVLVHDVAREHEARVAEHQAEQPDDPAGAGIVGEVDHEAGKVDLRLDGLAASRSAPRTAWARSPVGSRRGSASPPYRRRHSRARGSRGSAARHSDPGKRSRARAGIREGCQLARPPDRTRPVDRRLNAALDVFAHGLRVTSSPMPTTSSSSAASLRQRRWRGRGR